MSVGDNSDEDTIRMEPCHNSNDEDLSSLLSNMQKLNIGKEKRRIRFKDVESELNSHYGSNNSVKAKWQELCQDCGVDPPSSITKCEEMHFLRSEWSARMTTDICVCWLGTQRLEH